MQNFCCQSLIDKLCQTTALQKINRKYNQVRSRIETLTIQITQLQQQNKMEQVFLKNSELEGLNKQSEILKNGLSELTRLEQQKENIITNYEIFTEIENRQKQILSLNLRMSVNEMLEDQKKIIKQLDFLNETMKIIQSEGDEIGTQQHQQNDLNIPLYWKSFKKKMKSVFSNFAETIQELNEKFQTQEQRIRLLWNQDLKPEHISTRINLIQGEQYNIQQEPQNQRNELVENIRSENDNLKLTIQNLNASLREQTVQINQLQSDRKKLIDEEFEKMKMQLREEISNKAALEKEKYNENIRNLQNQLEDEQKARLQLQQQLSNHDSPRIRKISIYEDQAKIQQTLNQMNVQRIK